MEAGPGVGRSHLISAVELGCSDAISLLSCTFFFFFSCMLFFFLPVFPVFQQRNFEPGSARNDDRQLRRPLASPVLCAALHSRPRRALLCGYCAGVRTVGIELGRADLQVEGYQPRPFGCEVGSQFHHGHVSRGPPIMPDGRISRVRFEALAFLPWAFPAWQGFKRWFAYAPTSAVCPRPRSMATST